ncbi:MAG: hypothetical protein RSB54_00675 [Bacilli bacterium]
MRFIASSMYCKYVIKFIDNKLKVLNLSNDLAFNYELQEKLINSYIELEKMLEMEY